MNRLGTRCNMSCAPFLDVDGAVGRSIRGCGIGDWHVLMKRKAGQGFWPCPAFPVWSCRESNQAQKPN
jgi:hypothetical protein